MFSVTYQWIGSIMHSLFTSTMYADVAVCEVSPKHSPQYRHRTTSTFPFTRAVSTSSWQGGDKGETR